MSIEENLNNVDINILNVGFENNIFNANDLNNNNFQNSPSYPLDILMDFNEIKKNFENVLSTNCSSGTILNETDNGRKKHKVINTSKMGRKRGKRDKENEIILKNFDNKTILKIAIKTNECWALKNCYKKLIPLMEKEIIKLLKKYSGNKIELKVIDTKYSKIMTIHFILNVLCNIDVFIFFCFNIDNIVLLEELIEFEKARKILFANFIDILTKIFTKTVKEGKLKIYKISDNEYRVMNALICYQGEDETYKTKSGIFQYFKAKKSRKTKRKIHVKKEILESYEELKSKFNDSPPFDINIIE